VRCRYGVRFQDAGSNHMIRDSFIRHCGIGVYGKVRKLHLSNMMGMKNDVAVKAAGAKILPIENSYFENNDAYFSEVDVLSIIGSGAIKRIFCDSVNVVRLIGNMAGVSELNYEGRPPHYLEITGNRFTMDTLKSSLESFQRHGGEEYRIEGNYIEPIQ